MPRTADRRQRAACGERTACVRHHAVHDGRLLAVLVELGLGSTCMYPPPTRVTVPPAPRGRSQQVEIRPPHARVRRTSFS